MTVSVGCRDYLAVELENLIKQFSPINLYALSYRSSAGSREGRTAITSFQWSFATDTDFLVKTVETLLIELDTSYHQIRSRPSTGRTCSTKMTLILSHELHRLLGFRRRGWCSNAAAEYWRLYSHAVWCVLQSTSTTAPMSMEVNSINYWFWDASVSHFW